MARIFITGSTDGVGRNAARTLIGDGHEVVLHARNDARAEAVSDITRDGTAVLRGDLASLEETRSLARQMNAIGPMDAIIHNAGVFPPCRDVTEEGVPTVLMVNAIAPYVLSVLADRPGRLIFTGSSMHHGHEGALDDMDWTSRPWSGSEAYGESKLFVCALSAALSRHLPDTVCNAVDPGWVPTKMGGPSASDDLDAAHSTQCWLATSEETSALSQGGYWHHGQLRNPDAKVGDPAFQDAILARFAEISGIELPLDPASRLSS